MIRILQVINLKAKRILSFKIKIDNINNIRKTKYLCPECEEKVVFVNCSWKINHFKHLNINPDCFKEHETEEHLFMKKTIYNILKEDKNNKNIKLEYKLEDQIADVYCEHHHLKYVVECQCSHISKEDFEDRSLGWQIKGLYVMWVFGEKYFSLMSGIKKRLIKRWKHINFYIKGKVVTYNNRKGINIYKNPIIKPYLSLYYKNKSLIFVE